MKMAVRAMLVALATLALASPSFAATVAPTSYPFILKVDSFASLYMIMSFIIYRAGGKLSPPQAMEEALRTAVYITVGKTNRNPVALADLARRQAN
jgi:hypothetical protein